MKNKPLTSTQVEGILGQTLKELRSEKITPAVASAVARVAEAAINVNKLRLQAFIADGGKKLGNAKTGKHVLKFVEN